VKLVRSGLVLSTLLLVSGLAFRFMPQGRFWNARVLPLYYLCIYLLAAVGVYLLLTVVSQAFVRLSRGARLGSAVASVGVLYLVTLLGVEQLWPFVAVATQGERIAVVLVLVLVPTAVAILVRSRVGDIGPAVAFGLGAVVMAVVAEISIDAVDGSSTLQVALGLILVLGLLSGAVYLDGPTRPIARVEPWGPTWVQTLSAPSARFASPLSSMAMVGMAVVVVFVSMGMTMRTLPGGHLVSSQDADGAAVDRFDWGPFSTSYFGVARSWADYNYRGLEDKSSGGVDWSKEYFGVIDEVSRVGEQSGCGRMMWEYDGDRQNNYGTPMAFMMFPYFTDGCIGSQEGLYFEASATTPFHFLMQSELSAKCSCAQRFDIFGFQPQSPYPGFNIDLGIQHMQMLGIRYYMADSPTATAAASADPRLKEVGRYTPQVEAGTPERTPYIIYEVADAPVVRGLSTLPEVWNNVPDDPLHRVGPYTQWFLDPSRWDVVPASDGPKEWPRNPAITKPGHDRLTDDEKNAASRQYTVEELKEIEDAKANTPKLSPLPPSKPAEPVRKAKVSNIRTSTDTISFDVDEPGTPVLLTASYFPNWQVEGANGPWRVGPNQMVVVPTAKHVTLTYGRSGIEMGSLGISFVALLALGFVLHRGGFRVGGTPGEFPGDRDEVVEFEPYPDPDPEPDMESGPGPDPEPELVDEGERSIADEDPEVP
jgi:hypothetical protein